jgi:D-alanyl-D-alanine carboxypeptidase
VQQAIGILRSGILAGVLAACGSTPVPPAQGPAAMRLQEWLRVFNSGDDAAVQAHVHGAFAAEPKRAVVQRVAREMAERFVITKVDEVTPSRIIAQLLAEPSGGRFAISLQVEPEPAHRVSRFRLSRLSSQLPEEEALRRGATFVDRLVSQDQFSGVVLVGHKGTPVFHKAYGYADREQKVATALDSRFSIASIGKMFTAVAVMQLVQAGKVRLEAPVGTYLPDYPNAEIAANTTVHQLLTHTGGTGDIDWPSTETQWERQRRLRTLDDYIGAYGARGPEFTPGARWGYSNYGYILLGAVIERVSGKDYHAYVAAHVFGPAGMVSSGFPTYDDPPTGSVTGYTRKEGVWRVATGHSFYRATPAGGASTTASDMLRFGEALMGHKLLDPAHTELLTTGKVEVDRGGVYGYGVLDKRAEGGAWFGHGGGAEGMSTDFRVFPWTGYVVVALANIDPAVAEDVAHEFSDWLPR